MSDFGAFIHVAGAFNEIQAHFGPNLAQLN
jgi:hypothetical protein